MTRHFAVIRHLMTTIDWDYFFLVEIGSTGSIAAFDITTRCIGNAGSLSVGHQRLLMYWTRRSARSWT